MFFLCTNILIDSVCVCRMPPRHQNRNPIPDAHSKEVDDHHQHVSEEENIQQGPIPEEPVLPSQFARELAAAMLEASRSFVAGGAVGDRTMDVLREFRRMNPPKFSGQGKPLAVDHWLVEIRRILDTLGIIETVSVSHLHPISFMERQYLGGVRLWR